MDYPGLERFVSEMEARYVERADELLHQLYMRFELELQVFCEHFKMGFHMASVAVASSFDVELPDAGLAHDSSLTVSFRFGARLHAWSRLLTALTFRRQFRLVLCMRG